MLGQSSGSSGSLVLSDNATLDTPGSFTIAQDSGSTGSLQIGSGIGTAGADIGVHTINGGLGQAAITFRQTYAFGSTSDMTYNFESTLTGFLDLVQDGAGTTLLLPQFGDNTFSGSVTVDSGTLATASSGGGAALAGISSLTINGGIFSAGQSNGINDDASLDLNGGTFSVASSGLTEILGAFSITADSVLNFADLAADLTFASLAIGAKLQIWNYDASLDTITIFDASASGNLSDITFYSDDGQTLLGSATLNGDSLEVVPEPSTIALLALSLASLLLLARRRPSHALTR